MPIPAALCLENLRAKAGEASHVACVALVGREPGLGLTTQGTIAWADERSIACELWVSSDDRLILYRRASCGALKLRRGGRTLDVPASKPVVIAHRDVIELAGERYRVHLHGQAAHIHAPRPVTTASGGQARWLAAALAISAMALGACEKAKPTPPIDVRIHPPSPPPPMTRSLTEVAKGDTGPKDAWVLHHQIEACLENLPAWDGGVAQCSAKLKIDAEGAVTSVDLTVPDWLKLPDPTTQCLRKALMDTKFWPIDGKSSLEVEVGIAIKPEKSY